MPTFATAKARKGSPYGETQYLQYNTVEEVLQDAGATDANALLLELANGIVEKGSISKANQTIAAKKDLTDEQRVNLFKETRKGYTIHTWIHGARVTKSDKVAQADAIQEALANADEGKTYTVAELRALMQSARNKEAETEKAAE
jgi:cytochrome c-type biogenesis protein CcmE